MSRMMRDGRSESRNSNQNNRSSAEKGSAGKSMAGKGEAGKSVSKKNRSAISSVEKADISKSNAGKYRTGKIEERSTAGKEDMRKSSIGKSRMNNDATGKSSSGKSGVGKDRSSKREAGKKIFRKEDMAENSAEKNWIRKTVTGKNDKGKSGIEKKDEDKSYQQYGRNYKSNINKSNIDKSKGYVSGNRQGITGALEKKTNIKKDIKNLDNNLSELSSRCPVFKRCGGCQMLNVDYRKQLSIKQDQLTEKLSPFCRPEPIIGMSKPEHYRHKVHAVFDRDSKGNIISGVYKEGTHIVVPVVECLLENQKADAIIGSIRGMLKSFKIKTYDEDTGYGLLRHVLVRVGYSTGQIMVVIVLGSPIMPSKNNFVKALLLKHPEITTIVINVNNKNTSMVLGDKEQVIYGPGYIEDSICGKTFKISPKSFYQVNPEQTQKLYDKAMEFAELNGTETVLDAYCGTGTIGIVLSDHAKKVIGVELNRDAVRDAVANAKQNHISNIQFYQKDAGEFMAQIAESKDQVDIVFMDPPRSGSSEAFLNALVKINPKKVVYISCNPDTLVRDLQVLTRYGFAVKRGVGVDMFPFSAHIECVVKLCRVEK